MSKVFLKVDFNSAYLPTNDAFRNTNLKPSNLVFGDVTIDYVKDKKGNTIPLSTNRSVKTTIVEKTNNIDELFNFNLPITKSIITNIVTVLIGERPVSRFRSCGYELLDKAKEIAENAYLYVEKSGVNEIVRVDKACENSNGSISVPLWQSVGNFIGNQLIDNVRKYLTKYVPTADTEPLADLQEQFQPFYDELLNDKELVEVCGNKSTTGIIKSFLTGLDKKEKDGEVSISNLKPRGLASTIIDNNPILINKKGISNFNSYKGSIIFEIDESDIDLFRKGNGTATILDGGSVLIDGVYSDDNSEHHSSKYVSINEIHNNQYELPNIAIYHIKTMNEYITYYLENTTYKYDDKKKTITFTGDVKEYLQRRRAELENSDKKIKKGEPLDNFNKNLKEKYKATEVNNKVTFTYSI